MFETVARWSVEPGATGAEQMALDETMLRLAERPTLRVYRWSRPEVTFGYPQRCTDARAFAGDRPITRRCTGGGFVDHGDDVTIALAVPASDPFARLAPTEIYRRIHVAIARTLGGLRLAEEADCAVGPACFASPAVSDVLDGSRKVAGGALRRSREGLLYQGSVRAEGNFADGVGRQVTAWEPMNWRAVYDEIAAVRYGNEAWNQRR